MGIRAAINVPMNFGKEVAVATIKNSLLSFKQQMADYEIFIRAEAGTQKSSIDVKKYTTEVVFDRFQHDARCVICFDDFKEGETCLQLPCGHVFHKCEVEKHLLESEKCPLCR